MTRRVVRRKKEQTPTTKRPLTESEKKGQEKLQRVREQMLANKRAETTVDGTMQTKAIANKPATPQKHTSSNIVKLEGIAEGGSSQPKDHGNTATVYKKQEQQPQTPQLNSTKPTLRKKEKFEDTHKRMTTYFTKDNHQKLKKVKDTYGISITETINNALKEYFDKYNL